MSSTHETLSITKLFDNNKNELPRCLKQNVTTVERYLEILKEVEVDKVKTEYGTIMRQGKLPRISVDDLWVKICPHFKKRGYIQLLRTVFYKDPYNIGFRKFLNEILPYPDYNEMYQTVERALDYALDETEKKILKMHLGLHGYDCEYTFIDIAMMLNLSRTTIANKYYKSIERLKIYENRVKFLYCKCDLFNIGPLMNHRLEKTLAYNSLWITGLMQEISDTAENYKNIDGIDFSKFINNEDEIKIINSILKYQSVLMRRYRLIKEYLRDYYHDGDLDMITYIEIDDDHSDSIYALDFIKGTREKLIQYMQSKGYEVFRLSTLVDLMDDYGMAEVLYLLTDAESEDFVDRMTRVILFDSVNNKERLVFKCQRS